MEDYDYSEDQYQARDSYLGNQQIKRHGVSENWSKEKLLEYHRCSTDPLYFIEKYMKIITLDDGLKTIKFFDYQRGMVENFHNNRFSICLLPRQSGKCVHTSSIIRLRNKITQEIIETTIGELYGSLYEEIIYEDDKKFISKRICNKLEVDTPSGWQSFTGIAKTVEFEEYEIVTSSGKTVVCADTHIFIDKNGKERFVYELLPYEDFIQTSSGPEKVISVRSLNRSSNMYDLIDVENGNLFYTNNIVSHNTTTVVSYLLWYTLFNADKVVAVLANKGATAKEILARYVLALENIPFFLQPGCKVLNKAKILFSNNTKIIAAATSSSSIRGESCSIIALDELAFVNDAETFYTSTYPVISAGKNTKVLITSTPNGVGNLFHTLWMGAVTKTNSFMPFRVNWQDVPGRDEKWKEETIANTSARQFEQEFECVGGETLISLRDIEIGAIKEIQIKDAYELFCKKFEVLTPSGWSKFSGIKKTEREDWLRIEFDNDELICTPEHLIKTDKEIFLPAKNLQVGQPINNKFGGRSVVLSIQIENEKKEFFDCLSVEKNNEYYTNGIVSHNCSFLGSGKTLIAGDKLMGMQAQRPIRTNAENTVCVYKEPEENHSYIMAVDVSRGRGQDYSAFSIIDVTTSPFVQVATYYDNMVSPLLLPVILSKYGRTYNDAFIIVETNDNGTMVVNSLFQDLEYENLYSEVRGGRTLFGVETTKKVKMVGCSTLKDLVEENRLLLFDENTIKELCLFVAKGNSYEAETGNHDDLVMTLVLFAWFTASPMFQHLTDINIRDELFQTEMAAIENELCPVGLLGNPVESEDAPVLEHFAGQLWEEVKW